MLNTKEAIATVAVKDLKAAAVFYEGALGFEKAAVVDEESFISTVTMHYWTVAPIGAGPSA